MTSQIISAAIARSKSHTEIVSIHADARTGEFAAICEELFSECEGSATLDDSGPSEFWGTDVDGNEWRIHVHAQHGETTLAGLERELTDAERVRIRVNASGEDVYCGDDASALQIARGACDHSAEWSDNAESEAAEIARVAWATTKELT